MSETPNPAPVEAKYKDETLVRTVGINGEIVMRLFEHGHTPENEMAPEAREIFGQTLNIIKCREIMAETRILSDADRAMDPNQEAEVISLDERRRNSQPTMLDDPDIDSGWLTQQEAA